MAGFVSRGETGESESTVQSLVSQERGNLPGLRVRCNRFRKINLGARTLRRFHDFVDDSGQTVHDEADRPRLAPSKSKGNFRATVRSDKPARPLIQHQSSLRESLEQKESVGFPQLGKGGQVHPR